MLAFPAGEMPGGAPQLKPKSRDAVLGWWAEELGVNVPELMAPAPGVTLSASSNLPGVFLFRRGDDLRIAALAHKLKKIEETLIGHTHAEIFTGKFWRRHLPEWSGRAVGPALLFYLDALPAAWDFSTPVGLKVRGLAAMDAAAFAKFSEALAPVEREHSGLEFGPRPMWGVFRGGELLAVAGYDSWPGRIAHIGVAVHPGHRGKGLGQTIVKAAARGALARRRIVQYRTLVDNEGSMGIARALELEPFAETLFIRPPEVT